MGHHNELHERFLLMSIHAQYAERIFRGEKKYELRRTKPAITSSFPVLIYIPSPFMVLAGGFTATRVISGCPSTLWARIGKDSGVSQAVFARYYEGKDIGIGIEISDPWEYQKPIKLADIRRAIPGFSPPQVFRYLTNEERATVDRDSQRRCSNTNENAQELVA